MALAGHKKDVEFQCADLWGIAAVWLSVLDLNFDVVLVSTN